MGTEASSIGQRRSSLHGHWSSRAAFILAVTGSAVGLGNIWKFPYITGENGGGAFVLLYLGCVFAVGMPILVSEVLLGRRGRRNPISTMAILGQEEGGSRHWRLVGTMGVIAGLLILSFYSVIAGWSLAYALKSAVGSFAGTDARSAAFEFFTFTGNWKALLAWHAVFMAMTVFVVAAGVQHGLERAVRVLMPLLVVMLLVLVAYSARYGAFEETLVYLFKPDFSELSGESMLIALGHCFFTLSIGMGVVMAYGAYLPEGTSIAASSL
ncbi:MAG: sodium-dependent transporter, partial [Chromatiales bacterium]|nr:sodium-dependent transporter [Chromatiales bacterium]